MGVTTPYQAPQAKGGEAQWRSNQQSACTKPHLRPVQIAIIMHQSPHQTSAHCEKCLESIPHTLQQQYICRRDSCECSQQPQPLCADLRVLTSPQKVSSGLSFHFYSLMAHRGYHGYIYCIILPSCVCLTLISFSRTVFYSPTALLLVLVIPTAHIHPQFPSIPAF